MARESGSLVLEGGCVSLGSGEGLPFAPIVEALRRLPGIIAAGEAGTIRDIDELRLPETNDLGRLLPELGPAATSEPDAFDRPGWVQGRIFEGLLVLLRSLSDRIPVVLVVEDLHWPTARHATSCRSWRATCGPSGWPSSGRIAPMS